LDKQNFTQKILKKLNLTSKKPNLTDWCLMIEKQHRARKKVTIAMVGKYQKIDEFRLKDTYISVIEAINHASFSFNLDSQILWIDAENAHERLSELKKVDGIIVPQGWGSRGVEGKILAAQVARENKIPYLGLCFGMQMATIEFARNTAHLAKANTQEADPKTPHPVIHIMPDQEAYLKKHQYGGTIRLGAWPCRLTKKTIIYHCYQKYAKISSSSLIISERHRHRYEFNNQYKEKLTKAGLIISGTSPDGKLVEAIELPPSVHPFFVGTQFHPEYQSRPLSPHPIFLGFIEATQRAF
jgi:CTP synthase